jgi:hypothetical protein
MNPLTRNHREVVANLLNDEPVLAGRPNLLCAKLKGHDSETWAGQLHLDLKS